MEQECLQLRKDIVLAAISAGMGHIASSLSLVEIMSVLYGGKVMKYDANNPDWEERDYLILSKGHGSLALYAVLAEKGFFERKVLYSFGKTDSILCGEPVLGIPGVEASTGSLGHGLSILIDILNPERIVLGSVYQRSEHLLRTSMEKVIERECLVSSKNVCMVVPAKLEENIGDYAALGVGIIGGQKDVL